MFPMKLTPAAGPPPPAEVIPAGPLGQCDATASGSEDALIRLSGPAGRLLELCGSHFRRHELALTAAGWVVIWDTRRDPA